MDGSSKAAIHCCLLSVFDTTSIAINSSEEHVQRVRRHIEEHAAQPQEERDNMKAKSKEYADEVVITGVEQQRPTEILFFQQTCGLALRLKRRGMFAKKWILMPVNLGDYHWIFVGILNMTHLGTAQDKRFTAYFIYDSLNASSHRYEDNAILNQAGILNLIIFSNLVYGNPPLQGCDIRNMLKDEDRFAKIDVHPEDYIVQEDGVNCGIFNWMCMLETALLHSGKYQKEMDFICTTNKHEDKVYQFQKGDWFKLYRNPNPKQQSNSLPSAIFEGFRGQAAALFGRILTMKLGKNISPHKPTSDFPNYIRTNFRKFVWEIPDTDQSKIDTWMMWLTGEPHKLKQILNCKNPVITRSEQLFVPSEKVLMDDKHIVPTPTMTMKELRHAGMQDSDGDMEMAIQNSLQQNPEEDQRKPAAKLPKVQQDKGKSSTGKAPGQEVLPNAELTLVNQNNNNTATVAVVAALPSAETEVEGLASELQQKTGDTSASLLETLVTQNNSTTATVAVVTALPSVETEMGGPAYKLQQKPGDTTASQTETTNESVLNHPHTTEKAAKKRALSITIGQHKMAALKEIWKETSTEEKGSNDEDDTMTSASAAAVAVVVAHNDEDEYSNGETNGLVPRKTPRTSDEMAQRKRARIVRQTLPHIREHNDETHSVQVKTQKRYLTEKTAQKKYGKRNENFYAPEQRDIKRAKRAIASYFRLPNTDSEMESRAKKIEGKQPLRDLAVKACTAARNRKENANMLRYQWKRFEPYKELEATLQHFESVTALRYKLDKDCNSVGEGKFFAKMKDTGQEVHVLREWVVQNFEDDIIQAVIHGGMGEFVEVDPGSVILLDREQIKKLSYIVSGKESEEPYFLGVLRNGRLKRLADDYVHENFPEELIHRCMQEGTKPGAGKKFFHIPPGAPRTTIDSPILDERYPLAIYKQNSDATCLFSSFASALHYVGLHRTAEAIGKAATIYSADTEAGIENWNALTKIMSEECGWLQPRKVHVHEDILNDVYEFPTVVSLEAVDGGTQHAITVVGKLVFDSNCARALPLTKETLDYCCSSNSMKGYYHRVYKGYRFEEFGHTKKKRWEMLKRKHNTDFFMDDDIRHSDA